MTWRKVVGYCMPRSMLFLLLMAVVSKAQTPTPARIADASCAKCHAEIYDRYMATPMANASGKASERAYTSSAVRSRAGVTYNITNNASEGKASLQSTNAHGESKTVPLDYFLGSGHLGTTYLYSENGFMFESPIAWYAASGTFDMKPGLAELQSTAPALPLQSGCIRCHMSNVSHSDRGTINHYKDAAFLHTGVTCEACHGDTAGHGATGKSTGLVKLAKLSAQKRDSICINCHLEGDVLVERAGRSALDFLPGQSITDFISYYVYGDQGATVRAVSEVEQFVKSRCKLEAGERMSCTTCHDPHFTPARSERAAFFRNKCLSCHSDVKFVASHHPENMDCVSCHMKQTGAENIPHVAWTDHRILRIPETKQPSMNQASTAKLTPIFSESESKRDLAMAYYKALLGGNRALQLVAWTQLNAVRNELQSDPEGLDALGVMTAARGEEQAASDLFRRVLAIDPLDLTALSNLGTLKAKEGDLESAQRFLNAAFIANQDISGLASNVIRVDCMAGDPEAAAKALRETLVYNPGLESLQSLNNQISHCP